jgi:hypothetical protein
MKIRNLYSHFQSKKCFSLSLSLLLYPVILKEILVKTSKKKKRAGDEIIKCASVS